MAAGDSLFNSMGGFSGVKLSNEDKAEIEGLRDVAVQPFWGYISCT